MTEVAARYEVSRQSVHAWIARYRAGGLGGLADRPRRPDTCPHQMSAEIKAVVCEMRREHPRWGQAWAGGLAAAIAIGAIAGLLPALRAARMSPTQALWSI